MNDLQLAGQIARLKEEKNAVLLAHNYQPPEIQEIADFVGDSFVLSREAKESPRNVIVFCGVRFMAESAKILSPQKTVLLPAPDAGCPLADSITSEQLRQARAACPDAAVVCYINTSADVKAESDICCTSSNAVIVVRSLKQKRILFVPDGNLASYVQEQVPEKEIIPWQGHCAVHARVVSADVDRAKRLHPQALLLVHPEVPEEIRRRSDFIGSTGQIITYAAHSGAKEFVIGTEAGILEALRTVRPDAKFYLLTERLLCVNMKKTTLQKVYHSLVTMENPVTVPEEISIRAGRCLNRMLRVKER
mgnify:CR=1 FL=1